MKNPEFGQCCLSGSIKLPPEQPLPDEIRQLLTTNKDFRQNIRLYNSILAFTSAKTNLDNELLKNTKGTYVFRINGAIHHYLGL